MNSLIQSLKKRAICAPIHEIKGDSKHVMEDHNESVDCGYHSMPRTNSIPNTKSLYSLSSLASSSDSHLSTANLESQFQQFKHETEHFLLQIQKAIEKFVRPSIVLNILSINECLSLYQNLEKLCAVTKFMQNFMQNQLESNFDMLNVVFDAYKTYLNGLPKSLVILGDLLSTNEKFAAFTNVSLLLM